MILATAKFNTQQEVTAEDFFKETEKLVSHRYFIEMEGLTKKQSEFLTRTARYNNTTHSVKSDGDDVRHNITISAIGMIHFGRAVFCPQDKDIAEGIQAVVNAVIECDFMIKDYLVSDCVYRNGICNRQEPCGRSVEVLKNLISVVPEKYYRDARNEKVLRDIKADRGELN